MVVVVVVVVVVAAGCRQTARSPPHWRLIDCARVGGFVLGGGCDGDGCTYLGVEAVCLWGKRT